MILREVFVKLGLDMNSQQWAKGQLAADLMARAIVRVKDAVFDMVGSLGDAFIGYNARAEDARLALAAIGSANLKMPFEDAEVAAKDLYAQLQADAARTTASTEELVDFAQQIANPISQAGANMKELGEFTTKAVVAAKLLGVQGTAGLDIEQAIGGRVSQRDRFAKFLIEGIGKSSIAKFNKLGGAGQKGMEARRKQLEEWLNDPGLKRAIEKQERTWSGIINGIKDNVSKTLADAGKPLFEAIKGPLFAFGKWIQANGPKIAKGFHAVFRAIMVVVRALSLVVSLVWGFVKAVASAVAWIYKWGGAFGLIGTALGVLSVAMLAFGNAAVLAGLKTAAAWVLAAAPFLILAALVAAVALIFEDIWVGMNGGQSLLFELYEQWEKFLMSWADSGSEEDHWLLRILKQALLWIVDFDKAWEQFIDTWKQIFADFVEWVRDLFRGLWEDAKKLAKDAANALGFGDLSNDEQAVMAHLRQFQPFGAAPTAPPVARGGNSATLSVGSITVQTTGDPEDVKRVMKETLAEFNDRMLRESLAGVR